MNALLKLFFIGSLVSSYAFADDELSLVTLYNSEVTQSGGASTIAVVRQQSGKIKLLSCQKRYLGEFRDFSRTISFFNEGLNTPPFKRRTNCISFQDSRLTHVNSIRRNDGKVSRWVLSMPASIPIMSGVLSDLSVWTIDVYYGALGIPESDTILLTGVRVRHDRLNNPKMNTYRDTYKISGMAEVNFPIIE